MEKLISSPVRYIKGIGPKRAECFSSIGINSVEDLIYYFPRRYQDRTNFTTISRLNPGQIQTIKASVLAKGQRRSFRRRRFTVTEAVVDDGTGKISCVWFNQPYVKEYLRPGAKLILYGKVDWYGSKLQMNSPEFEVIEDDSSGSFDLNRFVPVYSLPEGIGQRYFRKLVKQALDEYLSCIKEHLSFDIRNRNGLINLAKSLLDIHFPENLTSQKEAHRRLSFDEFFFFQIPIVLRKLKKKDKPGIAHKIDGPFVKTFLETIPFRLTNAQERAVKEICIDMSKPVPMQRLLQGDVGSGKTIVSFIAACIAIEGGYQAAFMVPTEILAKQHYEKISSQVSNTRCRGRELRLGFLTGSLNRKEKDKLIKEIKNGEIDLVIGTHALLDQTVEFNKLGLVIIDEQHKFGVGQRALLPAKGPSPDVLIMTATPIPRTLAITLYGDLDISVINEMPAGRKPVKTMGFTYRDISKAYSIVKEQLKAGRQAFIVYPVIEESLILDIAGAKKMFKDLSTGEFKDFKVGLVHGRLEEKEQEAVMSGFKSGELDVLVSTTVLEVGIDIANATCMVVEHAERFGLSQLHQLRGRVGRGSYESFCILISDAKTDESRSRISSMLKYTDGFRIAEDDLKIRGPGEFFGMRQHGLSELKIANPLTQMQLLKNARDEAIKLLELDGRLETRQNMLLKDKLFSRFPEYEKLIITG